MPADPASDGVRIGVLTVSDRASRGEYVDLGGPAVAAFLDRHLAPGWQPCHALVPDEQPQIEAAIIALAEGDCCALVITTGGTGPAPRDVTPEATAAVCDRLLPGFGEAMRAASVREVPTAIMSRQIAGMRGHTLVVNLPGSPSSVEVCLRAVLPAVPGCIFLAGGPRMELR
ncbi:MAG: molybdopterin adenylyltransferase [Sporichthyaceae bacterium]